MYPNRTEDLLSPLHIIQQEPATPRNVMCFIIRPLQYPTAAHYQAIIKALYQKNAVELCHLLGQGLDLSLIVPDGGHTSTLLALAMLRDHDADEYAVTGNINPKYPRPTMCLLS